MLDGDLDVLTWPRRRQRPADGAFEAMGIELALQRDQCLEDITLESARDRHEMLPVQDGLCVVAKCPGLAEGIDLADDENEIGSRHVEAARNETCGLDVRIKGSTLVGTGVQIPARDLFHLLKLADRKRYGFLLIPGFEDLDASLTAVVIMSGRIRDLVEEADSKGGHRSFLRFSCLSFGSASVATYCPTCVGHVEASLPGIKPIRRPPRTLAISY